MSLSASVWASAPGDIKPQPSFSTPHPSSSTPPQSSTTGAMGSCAGDKVLAAESLGSVAAVDMCADEVDSASAASLAVATGGSPESCAGSDSCSVRMNEGALAAAAAAAPQSSAAALAGKPELFMAEVPGAGANDGSASAGKRSHSLSPARHPPSSGVASRTCEPASPLEAYGGAALSEASSSLRKTAASTTGFASLADKEPVSTGDVSECTGATSLVLGSATSAESAADTGSQSPSSPHPASVGEAPPTCASKCPSASLKPSTTGVLSSALGGCLTSPATSSCNKREAASCKDATSSAAPENSSRGREAPAMPTAWSPATGAAAVEASLGSEGKREALASVLAPASAFMG